MGNVCSMHNTYVNHCHSGNIPSTHVRDVINANNSHTVKNSTPMVSNSLGNNVGYVQNVPNIGFSTYVQQNPPINTPIVSNTDHYQNAPFLGNYQNPFINNYSNNYTPNTNLNHNSNQTANCSKSYVELS